MPNKYWNSKTSSVSARKENYSINNTAVCLQSQTGLNNTRSGCACHKNVHSLNVHINKLTQTFYPVENSTLAKHSSGSNLDSCKHSTLSSHPSELQRPLLELWLGGTSQGRVWVFFLNKNKKLSLTKWIWAKSSLVSVHFIND